MSNADLIEGIRNRQDYQRYRSPEFEKVLEVMLEVDRRDFLPDVFLEAAVDLRLFKDMRKALVKVTSSNSKTEVADLIASVTRVVDSAEEHKEGWASIGFDEFQDMQQTVTGLASSVSRAKVADLIASAMEVVRFTEEPLLLPKDFAYEDIVIHIGCGQTCSQPYVVAFMSWLLELKEGLRVGEIGTGCAYQAAMISHLIGKSGYLITTEIKPKLEKLGQRNLERDFGKEGLEERLKVAPGNGLIVLGDYAPLHRIDLTASVDPKYFDPDRLAVLLDQKSGIIVFPEDKIPPKRDGALIKLTYVNGKLKPEERYEGFNFVSLIGQNTLK